MLRSTALLGGLTEWWSDGSLVGFLFLCYQSVPLLPAAVAMISLPSDYAQLLTVLKLRVRAA